MILDYHVTSYKNKQLNNRGFSLVELIIAISIMAILAAAATPVLISYIDKARKAVDIQQAEVIFRAAELASTTSKDEAYEGWSVCYDDYCKNKESFNGYPGSVSVTPDGYFNGTGYANASQRLMGYYNLRPVAWCRGVQFSGGHSAWENTLFKSTLDRGGNGDKQRKYTNEFLYCMTHEVASDEYDRSGERRYDGSHETERTDIMYTKYISLTKGGSSTHRPECWILYRRDDTGTPEVWVGYKISGGSIRPLRRLYPDPAPDYK